MSALIEFVRLFSGKITVTGAPEDVRAVANRLARLGVQVSELKKEGELFSFSLPKQRERLILPRERELLTVKEYGLPRLISKYRLRFGLMLGAVLGAVMIAVSGAFVWNIEVVGNQYLSEEEVLSCLEELGLRRGVKKSALDLPLIALEAELRLERLAWLAINYNGTKAVVEMRETVPKPEIEDRLSPTNLIAERDGHILYVEAISGRAAVKRSDVVVAGQLLVSGIVDSPVFGYKSCRSMGKVIARTSRSFSVEVELLTGEKEYTGKTHKVTEITVFSKTFVFGKEEGFSDSWELSEEKKDIRIFERAVLPLSVNVKTYKEYELKSAKMSREDVFSEAKRRLSEAMGAISQEQISNYEESFVISDGKGILSCSFDCIEDIAKEVPIGAYGGQN